MLVVLALLALAALVRPLSFELTPNDEQCFYADMERDASFTVVFQVSAGGFMDVDLNVYNPQQEVVFTRTREREGRYAFSAAQTGLYKACFSNKFSSITTKTLEFDVIMHDLESADGAGDGFDESQGQLASHSDVSLVNEGIMHLSEQLQEVKSDQSYLRARERAHRNTNESTNARVLWWAITEAVCIVFISLFQVVILRKFFEVKRVA